VIGQRYELYFGDVRIGTVTEMDADFPGNWGKLALDDSFANATPDATTLSGFLALNLKANLLADKHNDNPDVPELAAVHRELDACSAFIASPDWWLVDTGGTRHAITCPNLLNTEQIAWHARS
jgi:hypothetical protein